MARRLLRLGALARVVSVMVAAIFGAGLLPHPARAACSGSTTYDMLDCAAAEYKLADKELNARYRSLRALLVSRDSDPAGDPSGNPSGGTRAARLQQAQRQWISLRDLDCRLEADSVAGGTLSPLIEQDCLTRHTQARTVQLEALYQAYRPL